MRGEGRRGVVKGKRSDVNLGASLYPDPGPDLKIQEPMGIRSTWNEQINLGEPSAQGLVSCSPEKSRSGNFQASYPQSNMK